MSLHLRDFGPGDNWDPSSFGEMDAFDAGFILKGGKRQIDERESPKGGRREREAAARDDKMLFFSYTKTMQKKV